MTEMKREEGAEQRGREEDGARDEGGGTKRREEIDGRLKRCYEHKTRL